MVFDGVNKIGKNIWGDSQLALKQYWAVYFPLIKRLDVGGTREMVVKKTGPGNFISNATSIQ